MNKHIIEELPHSFFIEMIEQLTTAPIGQMTEELRLSCLNLLEKAPSSLECYNHLIWISQQQCPQDISNFIKTFCEVDKYYESPIDHYRKAELEVGSVREDIKNTDSGVNMIKSEKKYRTIKVEITSDDLLLYLREKGLMDSEETEIHELSVRHGDGKSIYLPIVVSWKEESL